MKSIVRHITLLLLVVATLGLVGCDKEKSKREKPDKLEIVSIDKVNATGTGSWVITATIANNTGFNIRITEANAFIKYDGRKLVGITLIDEVMLPRRRDTQVEIPLRIAMSKSLATITALNNLRQGKLSKITMDYKAIAVALGSKITIEDSDVTLEELNKELNLGLKK